MATKRVLGVNMAAVPAVSGSAKTEFIQTCIATAKQSRGIQVARLQELSSNIARLPKVGNLSSFCFCQQRKAAPKEVRSKHPINSKLCPVRLHTYLHSLMSLSTSFRNPLIFESVFLPSVHYFDQLIF